MSPVPVLPHLRQSNADLITQKQFTEKNKELILLLAGTEDTNTLQTKVKNGLLIVPECSIKNSIKA